MEFYVVLFRELLIGIATYILMWGVLVLPLKNGIRNTIGKATYRKLQKEYKAMKWYQFFGTIFIIVGVALFWIVFSQSPEFTTIKSYVNFPWIMNVPFVLFMAGIYCRLTGFIKAMSYLM